MKENKLEFCKLMATKLYQSVTAVELVWNDTNVNPDDKAKELMDDEKVIKMITKLEDDIKLLASPTKEWVKYKLMETIKNAEALGDISNVRQCLDQLNKMDNNYDMSHQTLDGVNLTMKY